MLASELIKKLQVMIVQHGDLEVVCVQVNAWQEAGWEDVNMVRQNTLLCEDGERKVFFVEAD